MQRRPLTHRREFLGITAHGSQMNDVDTLDTLFIRIPDNVKVITLTIPGELLGGNLLAFHAFNQIIKHFTSDCLVDLFRDDAKGYKVRQEVTEELTGDLTNVDLHLYNGVCPEMVLNTLHDARSTSVFRKYNKGDRSPLNKWIEPPPILRNTAFHPDFFPFVYLKRLDTQAPNRYPPKLPDAEDIRGHLIAMGAAQATLNDRPFFCPAAMKLAYANDTFDVDEPLMRTYFDSIFTLSTFIKNECHDPTKLYNVIVFACRMPMYYDAASRSLVQAADPMAIDAEVFIRKEHPMSRNYSYMNINTDKRVGKCPIRRGGPRNDPELPWECQ